MKTVLVTGALGFVGRNLCVALAQMEQIRVVSIDQEASEQAFQEAALAADFIFHLAGVNRPTDLAEFTTGNAGLTQQLVTILQQAGKAIPIALSSSTQAALDNPYGASKRSAEEAVFAYGENSGAVVHIFRLPNVFGKWSRPYYNSVVATFCHNVARGLPITVNDPAATLSLVYIDDVVRTFIGLLDGSVHWEGAFTRVPEVYETTVGAVANMIQGFKAGREDLSLPFVAEGLEKKLYATYLSYLPEDGFSYPLTTHCDTRGSFTEFLRTPERGQVSVNISRPGITKGNHWHHTKHEKFLVVSGRAAIRFRKIGTAEVLTYEVSGEKLEVVDIPPGYTHNITNIGERDLVTLIWVNETYNPCRPDTNHEPV